MHPGDLAGGFSDLEMTWAQIHKRSYDNLVFVNLGPGSFTALGWRRHCSCTAWCGVAAFCTSATLKASLITQRQRRTHRTAVHDRGIRQLHCIRDTQLPAWSRHPLPAACSLLKRKLANDIAAI